MAQNESLDWVPPAVGSADEYVRIWQQQNVNAEALSDLLASGEAFDPYVLRRKMALDILLQGRLDRFNPFNEFKPAKNLAAAHAQVVEVLGSPKQGSGEDGWIDESGGGVLALAGLVAPGTLMLSETRTRTVVMTPPAADLDDLTEFGPDDLVAPVRMVRSPIPEPSDLAKSVRALILAGRTTRDIENITGASRVTISRHRKRIAAQSAPESVDNG